MSTLEKRLDALAQTRKTLAERIQELGIPVPDQSKIPHMMEATRIGLRPSVSRLRVMVALYRKYIKHVDSYYLVYDFRDFLGVAFCWGGDPPPKVFENVERIKQAVPETKFRVHATYDDPWLEVRFGDESVFINCWMRKGPYEDVHLVI